MNLCVPVDIFLELIVFWSIIVSQFTAQTLSC